MNLFKIGVAAMAAGVCAILAITSVFAHSTPPASGHSLVGSIVSAANEASLPVFTNEPATNLLKNEQDQDAIEAAELAAKIAAEQQEAAAKLAAEQAAEAAQEAAEAAAATCVAADKTEDVSERAADQAEDAAEKTNGTESASEDAAEKTAQQATDKTEDASETPCVKAQGEGEHHGARDSSKTWTFSFSWKGGRGH